MPFEELVVDIKKAKIEEVRVDTGDFFEAVLLKADSAGLAGTLNKFFGEPAFPSRNHLPLRISHAIKSYGGINPGQTLYFCASGAGTVIAMLWPWGDGQHITLKIIKC